MRMKIVSAAFCLFWIACHSLTAQDTSDSAQQNTPSVSSNFTFHKPAISLGSGVYNIYGDVRNKSINPVLGSYAWKLNLSSYIDKNRYYGLNFYFIYGEVAGSQRSWENPSENLNFHTDLVSFGASAEYCFDHFIKNKNFIRPFISLGIENIHFTPKGDLLGENQTPYYYWSDGTMRDAPESGESLQAGIVSRDYVYETDLRQYERNEHELGNYNLTTFALPIEVGVRLSVSPKISIKAGSSLRYTFSDYIDNVASTGTSVKGKKGKDILSYAYISLQYDLHKGRKEKVLTEEGYDYDEFLSLDEDDDLVPDYKDECPETPPGIAVDTLGCPLDEDNDGVPDYLDQEKLSPEGAWVNEDGVSISEEEFLAELALRMEAMSREEVEEYFKTIGKAYISRSVESIPDKFKGLDMDGDGFISFEELLQAIDFYFDGKLDLTVEDIYELNDYFFSQ